MNLEPLKAFGTWLSNIAYWTLEPIFGGDCDEGAAAPQQPVDAVGDDPWEAGEMEPIRIGVYRSQGEAMVDGGMGIKVGSSLYM